MQCIISFSLFQTIHRMILNHPQNGSLNVLCCGPIAHRNSYGVFTSVQQEKIRALWKRNVHTVMASTPSIQRQTYCTGSCKGFEQFRVSRRRNKLFWVSRVETIRSERRGCKTSRSECRVECQGGMFRYPGPRRFDSPRRLEAWREGLRDRPAQHAGGQAGGRRGQRRRRGPRG